MQLAFLAISIGVTILANYLKPTIHTDPTPEDKLTDSAFGAAVERGWGTTSHSGILIWRGPRHEEEVTQGGKGGGGGMGTWKYSQSFAMAFSAGPRARVLRIWKNKTKLIHDATSENSGSISQVDMRFYPGDETQLPDPTIEAVEGSGKVPGYRGLCYIVFKDTDTTDDGGRIPDLMAEITSTPGAGDPIYHKVALEDIGTGITSISDLRADKYSSFVYGRCNLGFIKINADKDEEVYAGYPLESYYIKDWDLDDSGRPWVIDWETPTLGAGGEARLVRLNSNTMAGEPCQPLSTPFTAVDGSNRQWDRVCCVGNDAALLAISGVRGPDWPTNQNPHCCLALYHYAWDAQEQVHTMTETWRKWVEGSDLAGLERFAAPKAANDIYAVLNNPGKLVRILDGAASTTDWTGRDTTNILYVSANNELAVLDDDHAARFWKLSDSSWHATSIASQGRHLLTLWPESDAVWCQEDDVSLHYALNRVDLVQRETSLSISTSAERMDCFEWDCQSFYAPSAPCETDCIAKYLLREENGARANVADIVRDLCALGGIDDVDVSTIDDTILGFRSPGNVAPRSDLEVLARAFLLEQVEDGTTLAIQRIYPAVPKPVTEIPWAELGAYEKSETPPSPLIHTELNELEHPKKVIVQSLDRDHVYERGGEQAFRADTTSRLTETYDCCQCVLTEQERKAKAGSLLINRWAERQSYWGVTSRKYYDLKPGDLIRVRPPNEDHRIVLKKVSLGSPGLIKWEGVRSAYQLPELPAGAEPVDTPDPVPNGYYLAASLFGYSPRCDFNFNAVRTGFLPWGGKLYVGPDWDPDSLHITDYSAYRDGSLPPVSYWTGAYGTVGRASGKWYAEVTCSGGLNINTIIVGIIAKGCEPGYWPLGLGTGQNPELGYGTWQWGYNNYPTDHPTTHTPLTPARKLGPGITAETWEYGLLYGIEDLAPMNKIGIMLDASGSPWTLKFSKDGVDFATAFEIPPISG